MTDCVLEDDEYANVTGDDYSPSLRRLWLWAKDRMADGRAMYFELSQNAFASTEKQALFLSDIHALCSGGEIAASVICIFIK